MSDCHTGGTSCHVIQYLDTNWIYPVDVKPWSLLDPASSESWFQHVPGTDRRISTSASDGGYLVNQSNPAVQSFFRNYARASWDSVDGLMMDDQAPSLGAELYYASCGCKSTAEMAGSAALRRGHESMSAAMTHSDGHPFMQVDNALPPNPYQPQGLDTLNHSTGIHGLISEGAPENHGTLDPYYSTLLDQISYVANKTSSFVAPLSYGNAGASYQSQSRRVQEGTMLLGYSPGHLVDWADLEKDTNSLAVWPEEGIYPTEPVQSMAAPGGHGCLAGTGDACSTGGHNDVQVALGVYRREFAACYDRGTAFGGCAAIVNTTNHSVKVQPSWLTGSYGHQITFDGGDVQSGGQISLAGDSFDPRSAAIPADDATLLAR